MGKNISKNISKILSGKNSPKLFDYAKQSAADVLTTTLKRVIQKTSEATGGDKIADEITEVLRNLQQNNSETVTNKHDKEVPKERYMSPEERQKIIDNLGII